MLNFRKNQEKMWRSLQKQDMGTKQREQSTIIQGEKISHDGIQHAKIHFKVRISKTSISHTIVQGVKIFSQCETLSWHTSAISHTSRPFSHRVNQGAKISHTSIQGAKFIPVCETRCEFPKCQFRTPLFKVWNFSHSAKLSPGTRVSFHTPQAIFRTVRKQGAKLSAKLNPRCEILSLKCENFARCNPKCQILNSRCENFAQWNFKLRKLLTDF